MSLEAKPLELLRRDQMELARAFWIVGIGFICFVAAGRPGDGLPRWGTLPETHPTDMVIFAGLYWGSMLLNALAPALVLLGLNRLRRLRREYRDAMVVTGVLQVMLVGQLLGFLPRPEPFNEWPLSPFTWGLAAAAIAALLAMLWLISVGTARLARSLSLEGVPRSAYLASGLLTAGVAVPFAFFALLLFLRTVLPAARSTQLQLSAAEIAKMAGSAAMLILTLLAVGGFFLFLSALDAAYRAVKSAEPQQIQALLTRTAPGE